MKPQPSSSVAILGAGSWGTAIAIHLARTGLQVMLWGRDALHVEEMKAQRVNARYLPNSPFPTSLTVSAELYPLLDTVDCIIVAVPSGAFSELLMQLKKPAQGLLWLTKGLDPKTHQLFSDIIKAHWGSRYPVAMMSGPSFAEEVARGLPTAVTLASRHKVFQKQLQAVLHHGHLRVYLSRDLIGVQLCGAVKNVLAIACGISDGLGYGANAKAALITRGLAEMTRLGKALGAKKETFSGLAGVGDLVLTCTDNQSRNRRFGLSLGQGLSIEAAEAQIGQVIEGIHNASQVCELAKHHQIDMPICSQVLALLKGHISPHKAVQNLMQRSVGYDTGYSKED